MIRIALRHGASAAHRKFVRRFFNKKPADREASGYARCLYGGVVAAMLPDVSILGKMYLREPEPIGRTYAVPIPLMGPGTPFWWTGSQEKDP